MICSLCLILNFFLICSFAISWHLQSTFIFYNSCFSNIAELFSHQSTSVSQLRNRYLPQNYQYIYVTWVFLQKPLQDYLSPPGPTLKIFLLDSGSPTTIPIGLLPHITQQLLLPAPKQHLCFLTNWQMPSLHPYSLSSVFGENSELVHVVIIIKVCLKTPFIIKFLFFSHSSFFLFSVVRILNSVCKLCPHETLHIENIIY